MACFSLVSLVITLHYIITKITNSDLLSVLSSRSLRTYENRKKLPLAVSDTVGRRPAGLWGAPQHTRTRAHPLPSLAYSCTTTPHIASCPTFLRRPGTWGDVGRRPSPSLLPSTHTSARRARSLSPAPSPRVIRCTQLKRSATLAVTVCSSPIRQLTLRPNPTQPHPSLTM